VGDKNNLTVYRQSVTILSGCLNYLGGTIMSTPKKKKSDALTYKGKNFSRKDKILYYGSMADKYIIMLQILEQKTFDDFETATRVSVQLQLTDPTLKSKDRIIKQTEVNGLYNAMDIACVWLDRALSSK
jgi:hypothetical protein